MSNQRRNLLRAMVAAPVMAATSCTTPPPLSKANGKSLTFVLVHGAWHGGWCWKHVRTALESAGHRVFTPTLTGMGERHHLSHANVDINTHIRDVVALIETEELSDVILVGHSYGGYPVTGVANMIPAKLAKLIYLDALIPTPGRAMSDDWPREMVQGVEKTLAEGFRLSPFPTIAFDVPETDGANTAWLKRRLTDMPWKCLTTPFPATRSAANAGTATSTKVPRAFIECTQASLEGARAGLARARVEGVPIFALPSGHDAMVTEPAALTALLLKIA
jgi:pimeloyl-ACP methyl ester carboxylesterase